MKLNIVSHKIKAKKFPLKRYKIMPAINLPIEVGSEIKKMLLKENPKLKYKRGLFGWIII